MRPTFDALRPPHGDIGLPPKACGEVDACTCCPGGLPRDGRSRIPKHDGDLNYDSESQRLACEVTSFGPLCPDTLLRAAPLNRVLRGASSVLADNKASAEAYNLAHVVDTRTTIDFFLSHNWAVFRHKKFQALILEFNLGAAVVTSFACAFIGFMLNQLQVPPSLPMLSSHNATYTIGVYSQLLGITGFVFALTQWHELSSGCGRHKSVFLDKLCIHQTDSKMKALGISKLGAFMRHSRTLVVLFSDVYFQHLWTVFEFACWIFLHPLDSIRILPVDEAQVVVIGIAFGSTMCLTFTFLGHMCGDATMSPWIYFALVSSLAYLLVGCLVHVLRVWELKLKDTMQALHSFTCTGAVCSQESDREFIVGTIVAFMKATGRVLDHVDDAQAIEVFEKTVQKEMPNALKAAVGPHGIPYRHILLLPLPFDWLFLDIVSRPHEAGTWNRLVSIVPGALFWHFVIFPVSVGLVAILAKRHPSSKNGTRELATTLSLSAIVTVVAMILIGVSELLQFWSEDSQPRALAFLVIVVVLALGAGLPHTHFLRPHRVERI